MRSFADRSPRARWPRLLVVVGPTVVLVACSHSGLNALVLREVVVDWPPGLEAILAVTATPFGDEITLAITVVDAGGAFVLVLPKPDDGLLVAVTNVYKTVPECQTDLSDPAVRLLFVAEFAIIDDTASRDHQQQCRRGVPGADAAQHLHSVAPTGRAPLRGPTNLSFLALLAARPHSTSRSTSR